MEKSLIQFDEFHVMIIGSEFTGKTLLFNALSEKNSLESEIKILNQNSFIKTYIGKNKRRAFYYYDTGGHKKLWLVSKYTYQKMDFVIGVFNYADRQSFLDLKQFFIPEIKSSFPSSQSI
jgi:GTPase SAR1 family protein